MFKKYFFYPYITLTNLTDKVTFLEKVISSFIRGCSISRKAKIYRCTKLLIGKYTIIHDDVLIGFKSPQSKITIGDGSEIMPRAYLSPQRNGYIKIGNKSSIQVDVKVYGGGGVIIGSYVRIATNTVIISQNHNFKDPIIPITNQGVSAKGIKIKDNVWIGANCVILDGVTIESGSIIGAGSVVTKNVDSNSIYVGVPAKKVRQR